MNPEKYHNTGCNLWIVNNSGHSLKLGRYHCNSMKNWDFDDIDVDVQVPFHLEFRDKCVKPGDVAGIAEFLLDETGSKFQLRAIWNGKGSYQLLIDWSSLNMEEYSPFPYPQSDGVAHLGWKSECCLVIQENNVSSKCPIPVPGMVEWMGCYRDTIGSLSLREMTLPGSHHSGTSKSISSRLGRNHARCQNLSLIDQLYSGIRVLDLHIAQRDATKFIISHGRHPTSYSLKQALDEVIEFIDHTTKEIVVLDFHCFNNISSVDFNFSELKEQLKELLSGYDLPVFDGCFDTCLHDLWSGQASGKRRVIVTWNSQETMESEMWPGVHHEWYRRADTENKLYSFVDKTLSCSPPVREGLWSVCVFACTSTNDLFSDPYKNAKHLNRKIDSWFYGCTDWTLKANVISADFSGECNNIIQASVCANILKGATKLKYSVPSS